MVLNLNATVYLYLWEDVIQWHSLKRISNCGRWHKVIRHTGDVGIAYSYSYASVNERKTEDSTATGCYNRVKSVKFTGIDFAGSSRNTIEEGVSALNFNWIEDTVLKYPIQDIKGWTEIWQPGRCSVAYSLQDWPRCCRATTGGLEDRGEWRSVSLSQEEFKWTIEPQQSGEEKREWGLRE